MADGLNVVVDGAGQVALRVQMVTVLTKDVNEAVGVVLLRLCYPVTQQRTSK